jgi:glycosyltransferase involved in cell wall biosynthesis
MQNKKNLAAVVSIGIVMRTRGDRALLYRALRSITNQSFNNWKLLIVPLEGEIKFIEQTLNKFPSFQNKIRILCTPEIKMPGKTCNIGLKELDTDYAVIHDDRDSWSPLFLERSIAVLRMEKKRVPSIQGVISHTNCVIETARAHSIIIEHTEPMNHWIAPGLVSLDRMLLDNVFPSISFIFSLDKCENIGYRDEDLPLLDDWDFNIRFLLKYDIWVIPEPLSFKHLDTNRLEDDFDRYYSSNKLSSKINYKNILLNKWLREDLSGTGNGLGIYVNQRTHYDLWRQHSELLSSINAKISYSESTLKHLETMANRISKILAKLASIIKAPFYLSGLRK